MEQNSIEKAVRALSGLNSKELELIKRTISSAKVRKVPITKMSNLILSQESGEKLAFKDKFGNSHVGVIKKINQRYVRLQDEKTKEFFSILPENLRVASKEDEDNHKNAVKKDEPRTKRAYTRRKAAVKKDEHGNIIFGRRASDKA